MIRKLWLIFAQAVTVSAGIAVGLITVTDWRPFAPAQEAVHIPDFSSAVERAAPAVVTIFARHATPGKRAEQIGTNWNSLPEEDFNTLGSGVLVSSDGFVLTNYHVVASIQGLYVGLPDSGQAEAVLVGSDPETDLALIKISGESGLPFIGLGDTSKLKVGQSVLAIGNAFDVGQTVTSGIISALGRHGLGLNSYEDFIQTDAAINQGNSGGALIDGQGRAVAVTVSSRTGGSSSFSVPLSVLDRLQGSTAVTPAEYSRTHKPDSSRCYDNLYPVPDFGAVSGASLFATSRDRGTTCFYYALSELPDLDRQLLRYYAALGENTFYQFNESSFTSSAGYLLSVKLYETTWEGIDVLGVFVSGMQTS